MWVVASHAVERVLAFGEAAAPGQCGSLKADGSGVVGRDRPAERAVALGTQFTIA